MFLRLPQNYFARPFAFLLIGETGVLLTAFYLVAFVRWGAPAGFNELLNHYFWDGVIFTAAGIGSLFAMGLYHGRNSTRFHDVFIRTILGLGLAFVVLSVVFYVWPSLSVWREAVIIALPVSLLGVFLLRSIFLRLIDTNIIARRVLVLGTGENAAKVEELEKSSESCGLKCVGFLNVEGNSVHVSPSRVVSANKPLLEYCRENQVSEIVIAVQERRGMMPIDDLLDCKLSGISIYDFMTFMERETGRCDLNDLRPSWFIFAEGFTETGVAEGGIVATDRTHNIIDTRFQLSTPVETGMENSALELHAGVGGRYAAGGTFDGTLLGVTTADFDPGGAGFDIDLFAGMDFSHSFSNNGRLVAAGEFGVGSEAAVRANARLGFEVAF